MSVSLTNLVNTINQLLDIGNFSDYCPNGLQVEGKSEINTIVTGVTASAALIDAAIDLQADAIIVHHGYFWKNEDPCLTGMKGNRIRKLMQNNINLLAYHLPLDAHPVVGNNAQFAHQLNVAVKGLLNEKDPVAGFFGEYEAGISLQELANLLGKNLQRQPLCIGNAQQVVKRIGWCTGAAQGHIAMAADKHLDCFVSGEISEPTAHIARERNISYIAAGHHATERYGVQTLGEYISDKFGVSTRFIDIDNPA